MSRAQHPSSRERHDQHAEEYARARGIVRALERQERRAAERAMARALRTIVQPHEPHHYRAPGSVEWSPPPMGLPVAPGGTDNTGFCDGGLC